MTPGQTASQTFTLTNSGGSATGMLSVSLSGSTAFSITSDACTGTAIGKGKSCSVTVQFAPTTAGESDSATLTATGKKSPASASITLTGSGAGTPDLSLSPYTNFDGTDSHGTKDYFYDFGPVASHTTMFTVTNNGTAASNMLFVLGGDNLFVLANDNCSGHPLAAGGATCTFDITATAPAGCNPGDPFGPTPVDVGFQDNGAPYIHLDVFAECPLS